MYARSTSLSGSPGAIDGGLAFIRDEVMPAIDGDGRLSSACPLVVDRESPAAASPRARWETQESMVGGPRPAGAATAPRGGEHPRRPAPRSRSGRWR